MSRYSIDAFSLFPYFTKSNAETQNEKRLQGLLYAVKNGRTVTDGTGTSEPATAWFAGVMGGMVDQFADFVGSKCQLVPIPSSGVSPSPPSRALWPMYDLAERLREAGHVRIAPAALLRTTAVAKAHRAAPDDKPSVLEHRDSLTVDLSGMQIQHPVTLLDDVLSSGTSAMGCLLALRRAGFTGPIRLLTATHTVNSEFSGSATASARSEVVWLDDRNWRRAWRPADNVVLC